jgi:hexokinase
MSEVREKVAEFLKSHGMYHGDVDMEAVCGEFLKEMEAGLTGRESSLAMIPTYIEPGKTLPVNERVVAMDAGGTNFRAGIVRFNKSSKAEIKKLRTKLMPGIEKEVSREEFFDTLAGYIKDMAEAGAKIGFCFSYPCEITPDRDAKLIRFVKEIHMSAIVGQKVGENLNAALGRVGPAGPKHIVILNDTVTALLAGMAGAKDRSYDSYAGFILGTGTNTCYIERNRNITKVEGLDEDGSMVINVESGGFDKGPRGEIDLQFDAATSNPGVHRFEKMISGAYLGPLCLDVIRAAIKDALFSSQAAQKLQAIEKLDTKQMSDYLAEPSASYSPVGEALFRASNYDKVVMESLIEAMVTRAAKLTAISLSAAVLKSGKGKESQKPVCIVAEGTTFYSLPGLKEKVEEYLWESLTGEKERFYRIVQVENATLIGAAIAGLTN